MNDSNEISDTTSELNRSTLRTDRRPTKRSNSLSTRRSKRTRNQLTNNTNLNNSMTTPDGMGSLISVNNELNNQNIDANERTVVSNESQSVSNSAENPNQMSETSAPIDVCIDLTEDDSIVENNTESDSEIQCISTVSHNSDLCIVRDIKRRNRLNRTERSIRRSEQSVDVIEIKDSQTNPNPNCSNDMTSESGITPIRKSIKCPVCLDDYSTFRDLNKQLVSTNCGHLFCDRCIKEVIKTSKSCPNCRKKIATQKSFHPIYL